MILVFLVYGQAYTCIPDVSQKSQKEVGLPYILYGLFSKGASKMGYLFTIDKNDISLWKLGNILILFNSKQTKEAGRAFKSKYDHLI